MPVLKVSDVIDIETDTNEEYNINSLAEVISDESLFEQLATLVKTNYEQTHFANPVAKYGIDKWKRMISAEDTLLIPFFTIPKKRIVLNLDGVAQLRVSI